MTDPVALSSSPIGAARLAIVLSIGLHLVVVAALVWTGNPGANDPAANDDRPDRREQEQAAAEPRLRIRWVPRDQLDRPQSTPTEELPPTGPREVTLALPAADGPTADGPFRAPRLRTETVESTTDALGQPSPLTPELDSDRPEETPTAAPRPDRSVVTSLLPPGAKRTGAPDAPVLLSQVSPEYPRPCLAAGHEGSVLLMLSIDASGQVTDATILERSPCERLDRAAQRAALALEYRPARRDGRAIAGATTLRIQFQLEQ